MIQETQDVPAWQAEAAIRKAKKEAAKQKEKLQHKKFMELCAAQGIKFGHVVPLSIAEQESMVASSGFASQALLIIAAGGPKPTMRELSDAAGLKRPIQLALLAAQVATGTYAYLETEEKLIIAVSVVGKKDHFCRKRGREVAGTRLLNVMSSDDSALVTCPATWLFHKGSATLNPKASFHTHVCQAFKRTLQAWQERGHGKGNWK